MINVALLGFGRIGQMHAKNISKGKMSAAYWADRTKWSPSKTKSSSPKWKKGS